jgi:hypothetical protein
MVSLYDRLRQSGLTPHVAWRAAFAIVPVPILLLTATLVIVFGTDHPAGKWNQRHTLPATALSLAHGHQAVIDHDEQVVIKSKATGDDEKVDSTVVAAEAAAHENREHSFSSFSFSFPTHPLRDSFQFTPPRSMSRSMNASP